MELAKEAFAVEKIGFACMKSEVIWTHSFLRELLHQIPVETNSLLDVGCGRGIIGALVRIYRSPRIVVGVDIFDDYLAFCEKMGFYDQLIKHDLRNRLPFQDKEFEVSTCVEVIEHLDKDCGTSVLSELERISESVIVTAPTKFFPQRAYDGNTFQRHVCGWSAKELKKRGYAVLGVGNFLFFGKEIKYLSFLLSNFSCRLPRFSSTILAVKGAIW
ncbi:MAG: class I SAM-dependent methyltransferase [Candidatus Bathyarchaeota archaeon]|nr:class I SAM-dependent methyltransferase [Candidatus Bathyarchaeota archaeon]MDH5746353.1 class I SAM-dependent methyltransferase [Candidatus Bathyarchaeota archaeon]